MHAHAYACMRMHAQTWGGARKCVEEVDRDAWLSTCRLVVIFVFSLRCECVSMCALAHEQFSLKNLRKEQKDKYAVVLAVVKREKKKQRRAQESRAEERSTESEASIPNW